MLEEMSHHTFPQSTSLLMIDSDSATTSWPALLVLPQLPRPGVYQVPYEPKSQHHEQRVTREAYPATIVRGAIRQLSHFSTHWYSGSKDRKNEGEKSKQFQGELVHSEAVLWLKNERVQEV